MSADHDPAAPDVIGLDVDGLHHTGGTISGRAVAGGAAARRLVTGLDSAHAGLGHPSVRQALATYLTNDVNEHARHLEATITAAGHDVSNVAATARSSDQEGAHGLAPLLATTEASYTSIHSRLPEE